MPIIGISENKYKSSFALSVCIFCGNRNKSIFSLFWQCTSEIWRKLWNYYNIILVHHTGISRFCLQCQIIRIYENILNIAFSDVNFRVNSNKASFTQLQACSSELWSKLRNYRNLISRGKMEIFAFPTEKIFRNKSVFSAKGNSILAHILLRYI